MHEKSTILIVDDELVSRYTVERLLATEGYTLVFAENGEEALKKVEGFTPDLILLDIMMPGMNGFEVCQHLRANPRWAELPIVMVTALDDRQSRLHGIEAGADDFISKPFIGAELRPRVRTITHLNHYRRLMELKKEINKKEAELLRSQQMATIGMMASGLAHEIMQPLQIILLSARGCQRLLKTEGINTSSPIFSKLEKIVTTTNKIDKITHHLHQLSREPKPASETEPVDVNSRIEDALIGFQQQLKSRGILLNKHLIDNLPPIQADKVQIEQIVINLITNARDALEEQDDKKMTVLTQTYNGKVQICFEDNGKGITPENLEHIFEPFFTGKRSTGLGLYIVQNIVQTYNGTIEVQSTVNQGTTFLITFPIAEENTT